MLDHAADEALNEAVANQLGFRALEKRRGG
jgi:hypothetical protein